MITEILNGVRVRIYHEGQYVLPLFECTRCGDQDSYFYGKPVCKDCLRECRCCGSMVKPDDPFCRVIPANKKILIKPEHRHICWQCYTDWKHNKQFQLHHALKDGWQTYRI